MMDKPNDKINFYKALQCIASNFSKSITEPVISSSNVVRII